MSSVTFQFKGKTALVTGAGQGIGRAVAESLLSAGAVVYALDKSQPHLDSLVSEYPDIRPLCVDLVDWKNTQNVLKSLGDIDLLVNNAGISENPSFLDVTQDSFDRQMNVNVRAMFAVSQVFAGALIERHCAGAIVNMSSQFSMRVFPRCVTYCTSKAAVDQLTRCLALELGPHQIRVNAVNPTLVKTELSRPLWSNETVADRFVARIPFGKIAEKSDVVNAVVYLLSDSAAMINGATLPVDGGYLAG